MGTRDARSLRGPGRWHRRALLILGLAVALVGVGAISWPVSVLHWMETPEFCGQCHTMEPQLRAHERSPHWSVNCATCHVGDGAAAFVKSKIDGSFQMMRLLTGTYQRPIPAASHNMTAGADNCRRCHGERNGSEDRLVMRRHFAADERNTEQKVVLLVKQTNVAGEKSQGIHWHAQSNVEYAPKDEGEREIDYVRVTDADGRVKEYVSRSVAKSTAPTRDILGQLGPERLKRMDCLSCHNRVGHEFTAPGRALDRALAAGEIDRGLPYVKQQGEELLSGEYASTRDAYAAMDGLEAFYRENYPAVYERNRQAIDTAAQVLRTLYHQVASPEMRASFKDYPSFLGHRNEAAGCFRCHDGTFTLWQDGRPTESRLPSVCSLCHTFPQVGDLRELALGRTPDDHSVKSWSISHRQAGSLSVAKTSCVECHSQGYCASCHALGIGHTDINFTHAGLIRAKGAGMCTLCHQGPFCGQCHTAEVEGWRP